MKFRKIAAMAAAGVLMLTMCACGGNGNVKDTEPSAEPKEVQQTSGEAGKPSILVVSFGTSYNDTREATIGAIEKKIEADFPDYDVRRAFTSQIIIKKLKERDNLEIDDVTGAMEKLVADNVKELVVQPTHVMNGFEYEEMVEAIKPFEDKFTSIKYGKPLLTSIEDYEAVVKAIAAETPQLENKKNAVVMVGHGTEHYANATYSALDYRFKAEGYDNAFIGTVEGYPDMEKVMADVKKSGLETVTLMPLMIVAGDHASNDICGDEEGSWATEFKAEGYTVENVKKGLGEYKGIQELFAEHVKEAIEGEKEEE